MNKKPGKKPDNIISRALSKLRLMEKHLIEETQVLDELKVSAENGKREADVLRAELAARDGEIAALRERAAELALENDASSRRLALGTVELKEALEKERAEAALVREKLERAAEVEKTLIAELERIRASAHQKDTESARVAAEAMAAVERQDAVKDAYEVRLLKLEALNAAIGEEVKAQRSENEQLIHELRAQAEDFRAQLEKERAEARTAQTKAHAEAHETGEALQRLRSEADEHLALSQRAKAETASVRAMYEAAVVKIKEQEIFSCSAASALREKEQQIDLSNAKIAYLAQELAKLKEDDARKQELLRLELEESRRFISHLERAAATHRAEGERLKAELQAALGEG